MLMNWTTKMGDWVYGLKPVPKYAVWIAGYALLGVLIQVMWRSPAGFQWLTFAICVFCGALSAYRSEKNRKNPKPLATTTRYTNPRYNRHRIE
jgi:hypothetical protein